MMTYQELGRRLKTAREAIGLTQEQVAQHLKLARVTISQIESGQRMVNSLELDQFAHLYGRDITGFLRDHPAEQGALAALFRAHPSLAEQHTRQEALRKAFALCREYTNLKQLLDLDEERLSPPAYSYPEPRSIWEAIQMGEQIAKDERRRLELGIDPINRIESVVESQGVPIAEIELDDEISGIFIADEDTGPCILVNKSHAKGTKVRLMFTIAHEYCHVLLDREKLGTVSKTTNTKDLPEIRANTFAAAFLMPEEGVRQFLRSVGKGGESSRETLLAYTDQVEQDPIRVHHRRLASSQTLTLYDIVQLHQYFGTSFEATLYRLKNLKALTEQEWEHFSGQREQARQIARQLRQQQSEDDPPPNRFGLTFLGMAIEAYRREQITYAKLSHLGEMINLSLVLDQIMNWMGLENEAEQMIRIPE